MGGCRTAVQRQRVGVDGAGGESLTATAGDWSLLVEDMEERVREWGGLTIWLGSDDEGNMTMLAGVNLYPDPLEHLVRISNRRGHPFEFYRKMGFSIAGVLPDANGLGKPDIFLAKSVARR